MAADKLVLDLMLVLPLVPDERDSCVERLISLLKSKGIDHAHVTQGVTKTVMLTGDNERVARPVVQTVTTCGRA